MHAIIREHREQLVVLCRQFRVQRLALFGSALDDGIEVHDLDFAVAFEPLPPVEHKNCYFGLLAALEDMFSLPIDLVEYAPIRNPYFRQELVASEVKLYEAA